MWGDSTINGEIILRQILRNDGPVGTFVGDRIYPNVFPPGTFKLGVNNPPAITIDKISGFRAQIHSAPPTLVMPRYQVTCWSPVQETAYALASAVEKVLDRYKGTVLDTEVAAVTVENDPPDFYEPETRLYQVPLEVRVAFSV